MDKKKIVLMLWIFGMLIPLNAVQGLPGKLVSLLYVLLQKTKSILMALLASELAHIVGHLGLFFGLVVLVVWAFGFSLDTKSFIVVFSGLLLVAAFQELFQLQMKGRGFGSPELFDFFVDICGGMLAWWWLQTSNKATQLLT